ncbi:MAG: triacylglycerol lipase [Myxococcales bacterium]|nr:triacylglycerol lipase [Myxococcales bacterium]
MTTVLLVNVLAALALAGCLAESVAQDESEGGPAALASSLSNRARLPIVLLHGMAGFDQIGPLDYFYGVKSRLASDGHQVFVTEVDPFQRIEVRAAQLAPQLQSILARTGARRVHLIAHSQGGLDARYLVSHLGFGDRVATVTTISSPHRGSRVADVALGILPGPAESLLAFLANLIGGGGQDLEGQAYQLTEEYATSVFNPTTPDDPRVLYYSVAGVTRAATLDIWREDVCDPLLWAGYLLLSGHGANDGLVSVDSARHGVFLGTVPADHLDEVGQILGTTALGFSHKTFYSRLARFVTDPSAPSPI